MVDAVIPLGVTAKTTSNRKEIWHHYSKNSCDVRYMPVWSEKEILTCRSLLYPSTAEELVKDLYLKWLGIARYVLKYALIKEHQVRLKEALDISNIESVLKSFGGSGEKADA